MDGPESRASALIHTVDRPELITAIDERAARLGVTQPFLLEVAIAGEQQKAGVAPECIPELLDACARTEHGAARCVGLMIIQADPLEDGRALLHNLGARYTPRVATILVIDDSPSQRAALAAALIDAGHRVLEAEDGTRAVELVREHGPELCFVDDVMPGPNGIRTIKALAEDPQTARVRCVYMQGHDDAVGRAWALRAGAAECLVRPIEPELALSVVARLVVGLI